MNRNRSIPRWFISPSWSSANAPHGSSTRTGPLDSPPLALRWSMVMQRKSPENNAIASNTAFGQFAARELSPPPGVSGGENPRVNGASSLRIHFSRRLACRYGGGPRRQRSIVPGRLAPCKRWPSATACRLLKALTGGEPSSPSAMVRYGKFRANFLPRAGFTRIPAAIDKGEAEVEPNGVTDDLGREPIPGVGGA